jgi:hypothetical protein
MSTEERNIPTNKYWTNIDGERYLQVEEVDEEAFLNQKTEDDEGDDGDKKEITDKADSDDPAVQL